MALKSSSHLLRLSNEELIGEIARQNMQAFSVFYDRHSGQLYGLATTILQDSVLAQDVIQEVFLNIWKKAAQFDEQRGNLMSWMSILCRNRCIDALRRREKLKQRSATINEETLQLISADNPLLVTQSRQQGERLLNQLDQLPVEQGDLIKMAYYEGYSQSEISQKLQLPLGTVKTRIRSGMNKLREVLVLKN